MQIDYNKKYLIIDKSGFDPFTFASAQQNLDITVFENFLEKQHIVPIITEAAFNAGEFTHHSYGPNLFSGTTFNNENPNKVETASFNSDGTLTSAFKSSNAVQIISVSTYSNTISQEQWAGVAPVNIIPQQQSLWMASEHWKKLSDTDKSVVNLSREFSKKEIQFAVLVNDWHLREYLKLEGHSIIGSAALLAGMVLTNTISPQRGTFIYYEVWGKSNPKYLPNKDNNPKEKLPFKEILQMKRVKINKGVAFIHLSFNKYTRQN